MEYLDIGGYRFFSDRVSLKTNDGEEVALRQQSLFVLAALAAKPNEVVSREAIFETVWPGTVVTNDSLTQCIHDIRQALDDKDHRLLRTVHRRGYSLCGTPQISNTSQQADNKGSQVFEQQINLITRSGRPDIAWACSGEGPPVLLAPQWMSHLELDWKIGPYKPRIQSLSKATRLFRFDPRGTGLSSRGDPGYVNDWVDDMADVVRATGVERLAIFASSMGGVSAIRFAAKYPQYVNCLVMQSCFVSGSLSRGGSLMSLKLISGMIQYSWGADSPGVRRMLTSTLWPGATHQLQTEINHLQRESSDGETAAKILERIADDCVEDELKHVTCPVLVLSNPWDKWVSEKDTDIIVKSLPNGQHKVFASENRTPLKDDPAYDFVMNNALEFIYAHHRN